MNNNLELAMYVICAGFFAFSGMVIESSTVVAISALLMGIAFFFAGRLAARIGAF